jgi:HEAT repeat protein
MSDTTSKLAEAIGLLNNSKSLKRESAAKRLRKMCIPESGEALLQALQKEVKDKRTWSTQYHLIAALGVVEYQEALPFLWDLTSRDLYAAILYLALGDAIFRLSLGKKPVAEVWEEVLQTRNSMF